MRKRIGVCRDRSRSRISSAVSNPPRPGIWTSIKIARVVVVQDPQQRLLARLSAHQVQGLAPPRSASKARRLLGWSSTSKTLTFRPSRILPASSPRGSAGSVSRVPHLAPQSSGTDGIQHFTRTRSGPSSAGCRSKPDPQDRLELIAGDGLREVVRRPPPPGTYGGRRAWPWP